MKFTYDSQFKILTLIITEEIDHYTADKIRNRTDFEIQKQMPSDVIIEFASVSFIDSAGIGMIIGRYKTMSMFGGKTYMKNVSRGVRKIFEMTGILKIIPIIEGGTKNEKCI